MKDKNFLLAIVLIITFLTHASFIFNGFTWLDHNDLELRRAVLPVDKIGSVFFRPFGQTSFYRPMVTIVNSFNYFLYQNWAPGYHLTNILLHLTAVALVPYFLSVLFRLKTEYRLLAALIFAVHPVTIMVTGLTFMGQEIMLLIFIMLTMIFYAKAVQKPSLKYQLLTALSFACALFSKETALVIVPALICIFHLSSLSPRSPKLPKTSESKSLWLSILSVIVIYLILRFTSVPVLWGTKFAALSIDQAIGTRLGLIAKWLLILISPFKPKFSDAVPVTGLMSLPALISIAFIILSLFIIIKAKIKSDIAKSILLLFIFLAPGLYLVPVPRAGSPHYAYLPAVAVSAIIVILISRIPLISPISQISLKTLLEKLTLVLTAAWIIIASASTFTAGFQFNNDLTLFTPEVNNDPDFMEGYYYLGNYYLNKGNLDQAELFYEKGLKGRSNILVFDTKRWIIMSLAGVKLQQNKFAEAENLYDKALIDAEDSLIPYLLFNQALVSFKMENYNRVIQILKDLTWDRPEAYLLLAKSYHTQSQMAEEIAALKRALPYLSNQEKSDVETVIKNFKP